MRLAATPASPGCGCTRSGTRYLDGPTRPTWDQSSTQPARISANNMTCLVGWFNLAREIVTSARAANGERELARDNFRLLPWTSAADCVRCLRMPPRCREHLMLGFSHA